MSHSNFTQIPNIFFYLNINPIDFVVYAAIKSCSGENGYCSKSYHHLAEMTGYSERTVMDSVTRLCKINPKLGKPLITKESRSSKFKGSETNILTPTKIWSDNENYFKKEIKGVQEMHPPGAGPAPKQELFLRKKETTSNKEAAVEIFDCLKAIQDESVTEKEKARITRKYAQEEERVKNAAAFVTQKGFKPQETLLKALNFALRDKMAPSNSKNGKSVAEINLESLGGLEKYFVRSKNDVVFTFSEAEVYLDLGLPIQEFSIQFNDVLKKYFTLGG